MKVDNEMQTTVSPGDVYGSLDDFSEDLTDIDDTKNMAFLLLEFPDVSWAMREPSVILGRDEKLQRYLEDTQYIRIKPEGGPQDEVISDRSNAASDDSEGSPDGSDVEDDFPGGTEFKYSPDGGCRTSLPAEYSDAKKTSRQETFLAIHPPVDQRTGKLPALSGISKHHVRLDIRDNAVFLKVLGRNGLFLNDDYYAQDDEERVEDNDRIRIAGLDIFLRFNPTSLQDADDDESEEGSSQSDAEAVDGEGESNTPESSVEHKIKPGFMRTSEDRKRAKEQAREAAASADTSKPKVSRTIKLSELQKREPNETTDQLKARLEHLTGGQIQPRKGPGRPPANGLMSKRQMRELAKSAKQAGSGETPEQSASAGIAASSTAKDADGNEVDGDGNGAAKNKSKKRKRSDTGADVKTTNGTDRKKKEESPRSPSPTEDQYTAEQLEHPSLTYVVMIHKILKDVEPKQLNLQQMYREVKKRWPYYRFRKESSGWESSVRHTIKSDFFKQGERDGKGFKYTIDPDREPPPQKQKPAPAPPQPVPYANGQYPRGPPYGPPYNAGPYRPNYPAQSAYPPYPMQGQRPPVNGATHPMPYTGPYTQQQNYPRAPNSQPPQTLQNGQSSGQPNGVSSVQRPNGQAAAPSQLSQPSGQNIQAPNKYAVVQQPLGTTSAPTQATTNAQPQATRPAQHQPLLNQQTQPASNPRPATQGQVPPVRSPLSPTTRPHTQSPTTAAGNSQLNRQPHAAINGASSGPSRLNPQIPTRPASQMSTNVGSRPQTPAANALLPSEEIAQGRTPQVILNWKHKLLEPGSNLPKHVTDEQSFRIDKAVEWFMKHPKEDIFKATPEVVGNWKNLVPLIQNMIREHDRNGLARRGQQGQKA